MFRPCEGDQEPFKEGFLELLNFTKGVYLPTARRRCRLSIPKAISLTDAASCGILLFRLPYSDFNRCRVRWDVGFSLLNCRGRRSRRPVTNDYRKLHVLRVRNENGIVGTGGLAAARSHLGSDSRLRLSFTTSAPLRYLDGP